LSDGTALSADTLVEGVHWDQRSSAADVGFKAVMVNASDLAAMGASPRFALLCLSVPSPLDLQWIEGFRDGLAEALALSGLHLLGGDTTRSPGPRIVSMTVGGHAPSPLLRCGGAPGEDLWVSGTLGDSAAGFHLAEPPVELWMAHARPRPPLALGPALAAAGLATAALDLSDGLARDLHRLARASGVGAVVRRDLLPISRALRAVGGDTLEWQVAFGEDYELLFSAKAEGRTRITDLAEELGLTVTRIGSLTGENAVTLDGGEWPRCWSHFSGVA
jgi:thiamine-monophosphate kinase